MAKFYLKSASAWLCWWLFLLTIYFKQEQQIARIEQRQSELSRQLAEAAAEYAALQELQQLAGSDAYIENIARDQLGMVKPGELVFQDE